MSMQTLCDIALAKTPAEKEIARERHRADQAMQPTDAENIEAFLSQCVGMDGKPFAQEDIKECAARVSADIKSQELKRNGRFFN